MLWSLRDKTVEFIPLPEAKGARCMSVSANGRWLVALSAGDNGVLAATGSTAQISKTKSVTTTIQTIRVDANGRKIELPSTIGIWDVTGKNVVKSGEKILGHAVCLAINPDHQSFGCVTEEIPGVQLRALPQGERIKTLRAAAKTGDISCLAYTADGKSLICGTKQGGINIWSLPDGTVTGTHSLAASAITDVALSKDGTQLAVAEGGTGNVTLWQFPAVQPVSLMVDQFAKK
jgi:WD40 repeat protein